MRLQLLLSFALIIAVGSGVSWWMAVRTTDAEFEVLIAESYTVQAQLLAPGMIGAYVDLGSWGTVHATLQDQLRQQRQLAEQFDGEVLRSDDSFGVFSIELDSGTIPEAYRGNSSSTYFGSEWYYPFTYRFDRQDFRDSVETWIPNITIELQQQPNIAFEERLFVIRPNEFRNSHERGRGYRARSHFATIADAPGMGWTASNLTFGNQRALIVDTDNIVVVDTADELLNRQVDEALLQTGVTLFNDNDPIGTLIVTSDDGVYTVQQNSFLSEVNDGLLTSTVLSSLLALVLALGIAYRLGQPLHQLKSAVTRVQKGEWGYQVQVGGGREIREVAQAFNQMSSHLAQQRNLRAKLVDDLAHELNTPLSLMRLELQGMADGLQTPGEAAGHLNRELTEVSELVSDLIFLANDADTPPPSFSKVNLNELVQVAVSRFEPHMSQRIVLSMPEQAIWLNGHQDMLVRAISNLLSNAIRHTPPDGLIRVQLSREGYDVQISVSDNGEGIAPQHLPHIFERFYRADQARGKGSGGRGLGLAIAKQIVEQHGGSIAVHSQPEHGTRFVLRFSITD